MSNVYSSINGVRPGRTKFNLSYSSKFDCDMGQLIPVMCKEVVPGDTFKIGNEVVIRFQPLVAPVLQEINATVHYFYVPNRLLMKEDEGSWEDFITGGADGETSVTLPRWTGETGYNSKFTLWDYFGLPVGVNPKIAPISFPKRAYNLVWNAYYRSEDLQEEVDLDNNLVLNKGWSRDYFTSALPWQQRGTAPGLPISGILPLTQIGTSNIFGYNDHSDLGVTYVEGKSSSGMYYLRKTGEGQDVDLSFGFTNAPLSIRQFSDKDNATSAVFGTVPGNFGVDLSNGVTFNVSDLRLAFQVQKWMERNARSGIRYTEFLRSHFGVAPRDERLQRPEYLGGSKSPVIVSEVLQTSQTTKGESGSPQGNLSGHGISASQNFVTKYHAVEFGWIIGILCVMPKPSYQQGVDRSLLRQTRYDYYFPEFAHLSEQAVLNEELYSDGSDEDEAIFGYQGRYNEMRTSHSLVCGNMRDTLSYWHLGRIFDERPNLNGTFLECQPESLKRIFAVENVPGLIANVGNSIEAIRPMPYYAEPGLIDHN